MDAIDSTVVVDRNGVELYEALGGDGTRSRQLRPETIPEIVAAATVAAEDRRFWSHHGIDPIAVLRAMKQNVAEGTTVQGGSTITQQTAKLLLLRRAADRRRGWRTKLYEAVIALRLEHRLSKREILALYLNLASYGNQTTGFARASRLYFGVRTGDADAGAGRVPRRAAAAAEHVQSVPKPGAGDVAPASRARAHGGGGPAQRRPGSTEARAERLTFSRQDRRFLAPHFVEMVLSGAGTPRPARIETTLDARLQEDIAGILRTHRPVLDRHGAANVAVVVLDNVRNEWLAWEGSGDYFDGARGGTINGPLMPRQPGSALKPFTYALAFEKGFTPASVLPDVPLNFPTAQPGIVYSPRNYDGRYRGPLLARAALAGSENVPAVSLASEVGIPDLLRFLRRAGFSTFDKTAAYYGLGLTLGNAEVRLDELVAAYAAFARGGEWRRPTYLIDRSGREAGERARCWSRRGRRSGSATSSPTPTLAPTSSGAAAAWSCRSTRRSRPGPRRRTTTTGRSASPGHVTVGVWVGNFDRRPLRNSSGVTGAAPIFQAVMLAAHRRAGGADAALARPDPGLERRDVCGLSGEAANPWCPVRRREWLPVEQPSLPCSWHLSAVASAKVDHLADEGLLTVWPAEFRDWAGRRAETMARPAAGSGESRQSGVSRSRRRPARRSTRATPAFRLANPPTGATYLIDPTLRPEFQTLPLRVVSASPTRVEWSVNGSRLGAASSESALEWRLRPGRHSIVARDARGNVAESVVVVR